MNFYDDVSEAHIVSIRRRETGSVNLTERSGSDRLRIEEVVGALKGSTSSLSALSQMRAKSTAGTSS